MKHFTSPGMHRALKQCPESSSLSIIELLKIYTALFKSPIFPTHKIKKRTAFVSLISEVFLLMEKRFQKGETNQSCKLDCRQRARCVSRVYFALK